jgi:hypothetical protein
MAMDGKYGGNTEGRDAKGHFSTGNPGKPQGARHKATQAAIATPLLPKIQHSRRTGRSEIMSKPTVDVKAADRAPQGDFVLARNLKWSRAYSGSLTSAPDEGR